MLHNKLLDGESTPSLKDNVDLWARVRRRLNATQNYILITWIRGHAVDIDIQKGNSAIAHQHGNNQAYLLADAGSKMIALPELLLKGHQLQTTHSNSTASHVPGLLQPKTKATPRIATRNSSRKIIIRAPYSGL